MKYLVIYKFETCINGIISSHHTEFYWKINEFCSKEEAISFMNKHYLPRTEWKEDYLYNNENLKLYEVNEVDFDRKEIVVPKKEYMWELK